MPTPLAHTAMGYAIYRLTGSSEAGRKRRLSWPLLLPAALFFSNLPDLDSIPGLLANDFRAFHNQWTHSLLVGLAAALLVAWVASVCGASFKAWFLAAFLSYSAHILMDSMSVETRGVMMLWPLTAERFHSPVKFFVGFDWAKGLPEGLRLMTAVSELFFILILAPVVYFKERRKLKCRQTSFASPSAPGQ